MAFVIDKKRTHYCGQLNADNSGETVVLMGWVDSRRDHGGLVFIDLRDRFGIVQIVFDPSKTELGVAKDFRGEFVIALEGKVNLRPEGMVNKKIPTGAIEIEATSCEILSSAETPPIQIGDEKVSELMRLKYRYLDLRSKKLQNNLIMRHKSMQAVRNFLDSQDFLEIETPVLYKSTPEGARDYLVPSRVNQGHFYALPQSPQTLKQLLMIGNMDRYFQIVKCFRDEDLRADRQPEFTQIDLEMSFVDTDDVLAMNESLLKFIWKELKGVDIKPITRITYDEAMNKYGCDKPDLRIPWELTDLTETLSSTGFKVFDDVSARGGSIKALAVPGYDGVSRSKIDKLTKLVKQMGAKGLVWAKKDGDSYNSPVSKFINKETFDKIFNKCNASDDSCVFIIADDFKVTCASLSMLRGHLANELNAVDTSVDKFVWVVDFPMLDYSPEQKRWVAMHHPFTQPVDEDMEIILNQDEKNYAKVKAKAYDLVCNGYELGGGSIRIHSQKIQNNIFDALAIGPEERAEKFGFFLEALKYGTPPHGGFAWGFDRLNMILSGTDAIRDVIAFPKTAKATCLMSETPGKVELDQLLDLGIRLSQSAKENLEVQS